MKHHLFTFLLIPALLFVNSCGRGTDESSASIFKNSANVSREYQTALAQEFQENANSLTCIFNQYMEKNGQTFLNVQVLGTDFEATGQVLVRDWQKIEGIRRTKGLGYSGAELKGLRIKLEEGPTDPVLVYQGLDRIID